MRERFSFLWRDIFWWTAKIILAPPLRLFFHAQSEGKKFFPPKGQAVFMLANHTHLLDPFMIADFIPRPIRYVISDEYFRYGLTRKLLAWLKGIPKTKNIPDSVTMRILLKAIKRGEIIGVFPEGARNWDGTTAPLEDTIPRLIHKLKIPVICIRQRGSYLSWPRWANAPRRKRIIFSFSYLFENPASIPDNPAIIKKMIEDKLSYSELEDKEVTRHIFDHPRVAEHLELRLWLCPHCLQLFKMKSEKRHLYCTNCGARWEFKGNGSFRTKKLGEPLAKGAKNFKRYIDWARWNDKKTIEILEKQYNSTAKELLSIPANMWSAATETGRDRNYRPAGKGIATLAKNFLLKFTLKDKQTPEIIAPLREIKGANIVWNHKFEFFLEGIAYRFTFNGQSAYFWHFLTKKLQAGVFDEIV